MVPDLKMALLVLEESLEIGLLAGSRIFLVTLVLVKLFKLKNGYLHWFKVGCSSADQEGFDSK